jgi:UDP-sulfoquinovose synthase
MRVLILGGDGYLGWPTAMRFSGKGHEVAVVDNFARRRWVEEVGGDSLTPIVSLDERIEAWREVSGKRITSYVGDLAEDTLAADVVIDFPTRSSTTASSRAPPGRCAASITP